MILCFDIGGSAIKAAIAMSSSDIRPLDRVATPLDDREKFDRTIGAILADHTGASALSISIAGVVNPADGRIKVANIPCIDGRPLGEELQQRFGLPVHIANDADCFALAEATLGAGRGAAVVFGIILGTGVGGGLIVGGRIVSGAGGFAGEWGHGPILPLTAGDPPTSVPQLKCGCGQTGCVDTLGGARGLERLHVHLHGEQLSSIAIIANWEAGDKSAGRTMELYLDLISRPLALVVNVVGANIVPAGGGLANSARLVARLDEAVRAKILQRREAPLVVPATCKIEPGLAGAAILGFQQ